MTERYQITDQDEAIAAAERQKERERTTQQGHQAQVRTGGGGRVSFHGDDMTNEHFGGSVSSNMVHVQQHDDTMVEINGRQTTRKAAEAAGLIAPGERGFTEAGKPGQPEGQQSQHQYYSSPEAWGANNLRADQITAYEEAVKSGDPARAAQAETALRLAYEKATDQQQKTSSDTKYGSAEEGQADGVLQRADAQYGEEVVTATLAHVAESGDLERLGDMLPEGFTTQQAQTVIEGYTKLANGILESSGVTVDALSATMSEQELSQARLAVVRRDAQKLEAYGREAFSRLAKLPDSDPEAFEGIVSANWPHLSVKRDGRGTAIVRTEDGDWISWGAAVQMKLLKL